MDLRDKTINYRRAEWFGAVGTTTLEDWLNSALGKTTTVAERTVKRGTGHCIRIAKATQSGSGGFLVHLTAETPGEPTSIVPKITKSIKETAVSTADAPQDAEYLDGDAFLYVRGNHVCMCTTTIRDGAIRNFFHDFFKQTNLDAASTRFDLLKVANVSKIRWLQARGVKEIEIRASLYDTTHKYEQRKSQTCGILRSIGQHLTSVLQTEKDETDDNLRVVFAIKTDKRFRTPQLVTKPIEQLAINVINNCEDSDEFVITTNNGERISQSEVGVRDTVKIKSFGKSVDRDAAWLAIQQFYDKIETDGIIEL